MLNPFIDLISNVISLINLALTVWIILGLLIHFDIVNRSNHIVATIYNYLNRFFNPILDPIRRRLNRWFPNLSGIDISPIILLLILHFLTDALYSWFYTI